MEASEDLGGAGQLVGLTHKVCGRAVAGIKAKYRLKILMEHLISSSPMKLNICVSNVHEAHAMFDQASL